MPTSDFGQFESHLNRLAAKFDKEFKAVTAPAYPEARLRDDYLNPFFRALGWDLENAAALIQSQREVEIESRTDIAGRAKRADYLFRIHARDRFVCEAKKPASRLGPPDAFQAKRYAFNMGLPLALLSDFEEIKVYIVGGRPHLDRPDEGLWKIWHFRQYPLVAQEIWNLLARENIADGSIDALLDSLPKRAPAARGGKARQAYLIKPDRTRALDADFLNFLDEARHDLASSILQHNPRAAVLADDRLNAATQHILDRLLFIRICEDRDIDTGTRLASIVDIWRRKFDRPGPLPPKQATFLADAPDADAPRALPPESLWSAITAHFRALDHRPPGNVPFFNGQLFKHHFSEDLLVGDRWLADFISELSDDKSPYLFNIIPVEILGSVYERFLGKVIRPQGRGVTTEEKPEVRKAGGVYYTPRYIVDYIVEQTVGKLTGEIAGAAPKFATLEKCSRALRILDPACGSGSFLIRAFERMCEHWLTWFTAHPEDQKKKDCWVDEKTGDVHLTVDLKRRILRDNVFGVDLDPQAVEVTQLSLYLKMLEGETRQTLAREREFFGEAIALLPPLDANIKCGNSLIASDFSLVAEDLIRVRAFDWPVQFREVMKTGGFDAVIGNPPYVLMQILEDRHGFEYLGANFRSARYKIDTYQVFMERALDLCREFGVFGFITPSSFLRNKHALALREFILEKAEVASLRIFFYPVFRGASVDTCILVAKRTATPYPAATTIKFLCSRSYEQTDEMVGSQSRWLENHAKNFDLPVAGGGDALLEKVAQNSFPLGDIATAYFGIQTHDRKEFVASHKDTPLHRPCIDGTNILRYDLLDGSEFVDTQPRAIKSGGKAEVYKNERIGVRQIGRSPIATLVPGGLYSLNTIYNIFFTKPTKLNLRFVLGLMQSALYRWLWVQLFFDQKETFPKVKKEALLAIPVPTPEIADKKTHDRLVALVDKMLDLTPKLRAEMNDAKRAVLENALAATDHQIDALVYQLYALSPEEIALVEAAPAS